MEVKTFSLGPIGTNCYIVIQEKDCLIVDPGGNPEIITNFIQENQLTPLAILLTHAHFDHIGAVDPIRKEYSIPVYLHENEQDWLKNPRISQSMAQFLQGINIKSEKPDVLFKEEGKLTIGPFTFDVLYTPGHSPGSVSFAFIDQQFVISGDVLFYGSIGRTDLEFGDINVLAQSIVEKLYTLPDEFIVYPGHGEATKIGFEKNNNPFTRQFYRN